MQLSEEKFRRPEHELDIQVLHVQRVVFDELAAGFNVFAHQRGEDGFALGDVFELHRQQRAPLRDPWWFPTAAAKSFRPDLCSAAR